MKRSINRWTTTLATAAMLGLPVVGFANTPQDPAPQQQPPPTQPQPAQPQPAQPQPMQPPVAPQSQQPAPTVTSQQLAPSAPAVSPQEHLNQAKAAADSIIATSVPEKSRTQLAQLRKRLAALEKAGPPTTPSATHATKSNTTWATDVAAIDKIITEMLGSERATGTSATPDAAGTTGKAATPIALDDATRAKVMDVRTHITAYAAGMSGTATATPKTDAPAASPDPTAAATPAQQPPSTPPAAAPSPAVTAPSPAAAVQPQADAARSALTAARDSLTQLTQLPAAAQLSGDARIQVGQLIVNFNELTSAESNWRASYTKVAANLTALLGPDNGDGAATASAPAAATAPTGTAGTVGTSGATALALDPIVRAKLVELRRNLAEFEKASGGTEK